MKARSAPLRTMKRQPQISTRALPAAAVRRALLRWHAAHARNLPWRRSRDAYAVWVSEIMLQQTQVAAVIPYYERFMAAFPTVRALARAPFERVAERWAGLGYYRRARLLHQAARKLVDEHEGRFPSDYRAARALPGVGDYTASAVLSIAYDRPLAVVDGNVARVCARLAATRGHFQQAAFRRAIEVQAQALLSRRKPGMFNQAMMELGQTVCLPRGPRCGACPLRAWCLARREGSPERYPQPRPQRRPQVRWLAAALIRRNGSWALVRGLDDELLADLWNFPSAFGNSRNQAASNLKKRLIAIVRAPVRLGPVVGAVRHTITFRSIRAELYAADLPARVNPRCLRWLTPSQIEDAAVSQLAKKMSRAAHAL